MTKEQQFFNEYRLMYRPFINQINLELEKHGLFSSQWGLLRMLSEQGPKTYGEIATLLYIEKPSVTKLVQKLIELELVSIQSGKDKREKIVHLTAHGVQKIDHIQQNLKPMLQKALHGVSDEQTEIAQQVLEQIRKNLMNG